MTTTEQEVQAGPELDRQVCEALGIPGRVLYYAQAPGREGAGWDFSESRAEIEHAIAEKNEQYPHGWAANSTVASVTRYPQVSADAAAAWRVLELLVAGGARVSVHNRAVGPWACWICLNPGAPTERTFFETAETAPLAICRAAKAALTTMEVARG